MTDSIHDFEIHYLQFAHNSFVQVRVFSQSIDEYGLNRLQVFEVFGANGRFLKMWKFRYFGQLAPKRINLRCVIQNYLIGILAIYNLIVLYIRLEANVRNFYRTFSWPWEIFVPTTNFVKFLNGKEFLQKKLLINENIPLYFFRFSVKYLRLNMPVPPCIPKTNNYEKVLSSKIHSLFVHSINRHEIVFWRFVWRKSKIIFFSKNRKNSSSENSSEKFRISLLNLEWMSFCNKDYERIFDESSFS